MKNQRITETPRFRSAVAGAAAGALLLTACAGEGEPGGAGGEGEVTAADVAAALSGDEDVELTVWGWAVNQYTPAIEEFQEVYPHITIDFVTGAAGTEMYTNYQNAVQANSGIPDVLQFEYYAIPQYAATGSLLNFSSESIESEIGSLYNESAWSSVHVADGLYGIPTDQAPTVMFYRQDILDGHGVDVPTTWQEFEEIGNVIRAEDPSAHLSYFYLYTNAQPLLSMFRFAGVKPWSVDGLENVTLALQSEEIREVTDFLRRNIDSGVIGPISPAGEEFGRALMEGTYISGIEGSWRGANIANQFPDLAGTWRAALPPTWGDGRPLTNSVDGGSAFAISAAIPDEKKAAAIAFANWMGSDPAGVDILVDEGLFSAARSFQEDSDQAAATSEYFGDQAVNAVYFEAAHAVSTDWDDLPFMQEVNVSYGDIVLPAITGGGDIYEALGEWQQHLYDWGTSQGFTMTIAE